VRTDELLGRATSCSVDTPGRTLARDQRQRFRHDAARRPGLDLARDLMVIIADDALDLGRDLVHGAGSSNGGAQCRVCAK